MHMLESAMAFAVVMVIFSTIVTGLVEAILRLFALRQKALGHMPLLANEDHQFSLTTQCGFSFPEPVRKPATNPPASWYEFE